MSKHRALVVDDSRFMREWCADILEKNGVEVVTRSDGAQCCRDIVDIAPDVVIMDLEMPVMDGITALRELRRNAAAVHIPILILTSRATLETKITALDAGANDFLSKDTDEAELVARVNSLFRVNDLEKALIDERNKLSCILNDLADPVVIVGQSGRVILANEAAPRLLREPRDFSDLDAEELAQDLCNGSQLLEALEVDESRETEVRLETPEQIYVFKVITTTVYQFDGQVLGKALVFHDITREQEIRQMKADFMSMIAHDLRSPISVITGYTGLLLGGKTGELNKTQMEFLSGVRDRANAMLKLVDEFLTVSKFEASFVHLDRQPIDVAAIVDESIKSLEVIANAKKITLSFHEHGDVLRVDADADKLQKVFTNLVDNALKYTGAGGTVDVSICEVGEGVQIAVKDSGIGISDEEMTYVFDRYQRASAAKNRKIKGTGLGLAIVSEIVSAHGGKAWAESELNKGSTFYVVLPSLKKAKASGEKVDTVS